MIKKCEFCTNSFNSIRPEARYCSATCKTKAFNYRHAGKPVNGTAEPPSNVPDYYAAQRTALDDNIKSMLTPVETTKSVTHTHRHEHTAQKTDLANHTAKQAITAGVATLKDMFISQSRGLGDGYFVPQSVPVWSVGGTIVGGVVGYLTSSGSNDIVKVVATLLGAGVGYYLGSNIQQEYDARALAFAGERVRQRGLADSVTGFFGNVLNRKANPSQPITTEQLRPVLASHIASIKQPTIEIPSGYGEFVGGITLGCHVLTYGAKDTGKSQFHYNLARTLSNMGRVLYVTAERSANEVGNALAGTNVEVLSAYNPDDVLNSVAGYNYVIIDSLNGLYPGKRVPVDFVKELRRRNPQTTFFHVIQATKDGSYAVPEEVAHESDIMQQTDLDEQGYYVEIMRNKASGRLGRHYARSTGRESVPVLRINRV
jgi:uncharacterized protein YcfJ